MSEVKPGTPEYDKAYQDEMTRLEAVAGGKKDETKVESHANDDTPSNDGKAEVVAKKDFDTVEKRLKDTQRALHQNTAEIARLRREAEERTRKEAEAKVQPIFDANPGLKEAIQIASPKAPEKSNDEVWLDTVSRALPDVDGLLADPDFAAKARQKQVELGASWMDPLVAIRELSELKTQHVTQQATVTAIEAARKDFEEKSKKREAMSVPGSRGGRPAAEAPDDEAARFRTMTSAEIRAEAARVMGYTP